MSLLCPSPNTAYFYPRSPCGERLMYALELADPVLFLSTLSLRRATVSIKHCRLKNLYFYPRSPCGERQILFGGALLCIVYFYPRSPCGERPQQRIEQSASNKFLSTLSLRRATWQRGSRVTYVEISIHALLAESDFIILLDVGSELYFYPRSPCGERPPKIL